MPNVVAHIYNCGIEKVEAGKSEIADQSTLDSFVWSQKKKKDTLKKGRNYFMDILFIQ